MYHLKNKKYLIVLLFLTVVVASCGGNTTTEKEDSTVKLDSIPKEEVIGVSIIKTDKGDYTEIKWCPSDGEGSCSPRYFDKDGNEVNASDVPQEIEPPHRYLDDGLEDLLKSTPTNLREQLVDVIVHFRLLSPEETTVGDVMPESSGSFGSNEPVKCNIGGVAVDEETCTKAMQGKDKRIEQMIKEIAADRKLKLDKLLEREKWIKLTAEEYDLVSKGKDLVIKIKMNDINRFVEENHDIIDQLELPDEIVPANLNSALEEAGVGSVLRNHSSYHGAGTSIFMSEKRCVSIQYSATDRQRYWPLAGSVCKDEHSLSILSILRKVAPESSIYCMQDGLFPFSNLLLYWHLALKSYTVVNASFSSGRSQGKYASKDKFWDNYSYNHNTLVVAPAGNTGQQSGFVTSPGNGLNVLTVGNYDDYTKSIHSTSGYKNPLNTRHRKPEVSAPGMRIDAGFDLGDHISNPKTLVKSGTSQAGAIVSGIAADLVSGRPFMNNGAALLKAFIMASAINKVNDLTERIGGTTRNRGATGVGGVNISALLNNSWHGYWWNFSPKYWDYMDRDDDVPSNGMLDNTIFIPIGKKVRAVLVWLNRGSWTYQHLGLNCKIGLDLDFQVTGEQSGFIKSSRSCYNGYEIVDFETNRSDRYTFSINRFSKRDTDSKYKIGLVVLIRN